ncbi:MAG: TRAP transporter small permease subunit [Deltaproteobacteria bacterium]|nr:TRAP transporter small permease subunit [Deltaproteobacteria bacterium]
MKKLLSFIDALSIWTGKTSGWLIFIVVFFIIYEVLSRYIFHHPTLWVTESVVFGCGLSYVLGAAWALQDNRHVKIDMIYDRLNSRRRAIMDSITFVFFALYLGVLLWATTKYAWHSVLLRETSGSAWDPVIYPIKMALPIGVALLLLQGIAKFIRDLHRAIKGTKL